MFAILKTGGKQLKVNINDEIYVEKLEIEENSKISFKEVLMINDTIGSPFIKDAEIIGTVLKQGRAKKIVVFKYKPKKNYHKKYGHRQPYTKVRIDQFLINNKEIKLDVNTQELNKAIDTKEITVKTKKIITEKNIKTQNSIKKIKK